MVKQIKKKISLLGLTLYKKVSDEQGFTHKHYVLGGLVRYKENHFHWWSLYILGVEVLSYNQKQLKFFFLPIWHFNWRKKWLDKLQNKIPNQYDDVYILRHNIGETTIELMYLKERIINHHSKNPLLIVWSKKNIDFYNMFISDIIDVQYVKLHQFDIMEVFAETQGSSKEVIINHNQQRFICSSPDIAENMLLIPNSNFISHIQACIGVAPQSQMQLPHISQDIQRKVDAIIKEQGLKEKFIIFAPEAHSMQQLSVIFWEQLAEYFSSLGYDIYLNAHLHTWNIPQAKAFPLTIAELYYLSTLSERIITMGSGLAVLLSLSGKQMDVIYTKFVNNTLNYTATQAIEKYSLKHMPQGIIGRVIEYNTDDVSPTEIMRNIMSN